MIADLGHDALQAVVYSDDPVLLMFGDDEENLARGREAAARAGCHVAGVLPIHAALDRLDAQVAADAALLFVDRPGDTLDSLLDRIEEEARRGRMTSVIVAPPAMIDAVSRPSFHPRVTHLFDREALTLQAALAAATAPVPPQLHDVTRSNGVTMLQQLSEEAARLAATLASMSDSPIGSVRVMSPTAAADQPEVEPVFVRSIIRARRMRDQFFRGELFADPAFDMLLDLYAARLEDNRVAVSSLCIAAAVPATTALRWIKALTDRGLFVRSADPQDGRRVYIELSGDAARAMGHYLAAVQRAGIMAV